MTTYLFKNNSFKYVLLFYSCKLKTKQIFKPKAFWQSFLFKKTTNYLSTKIVSVSSDIKTMFGILSVDKSEDSSVPKKCVNAKHQITNEITFY